MLWLFFFCLSFSTTLKSMGPRREQSTATHVTPSATHTFPNHTHHNTHLTQSHPPQHTPYPITPSTTHTLPNHTLHNTHLTQSHPPQHTPSPITPSTTHTLPNHTLHNTHLTQSHLHSTVNPRLSEHRLSESSIIRIAKFAAHVHSWIT